MLQNLIKYEQINQKFIDAAIRKMINHLWYLSPETAALGLFDDALSMEIKEKMAEAITFDGNDKEDSYHRNRLIIQKK